VARVFYELDNAAPKLGELAEYLRGVTMQASDLPRAQTFRIHLQNLLSQLDRLVIEVVKPQAHLPVDTSAAQVFQSSSSILPPSPEKRQTRKDSYGIH
jgi:hypothetical protein